MAYRADNGGQQSFLPSFLRQGLILISQFASVLDKQQTSTGVVDIPQHFYMDVLYLSSGPSLSSELLPQPTEVFPMMSKYLSWCLHTVPNPGFIVIFV